MRMIDADAIEMELGVEDRDLYVQHILDSTPTIDAEPIKHGRWNMVVHSNNHITYYCPKCGSIFNKGCADLGEYNYCPNCGARMFDNDIDVSDKNVGKIDEVENDRRNI